MGWRTEAANGQGRRGIAGIGGIGDNTEDGRHRREMVRKGERWREKAGTDGSAVWSGD